MSLKVLLNANGCIDLTDFFLLLLRYGEEPRKQIRTFHFLLTVLYFKLGPFKIGYRFLETRVYIAKLYA